jgi:hypothetical protein
LPAASARRSSTAFRLEDGIDRRITWMRLTHHRRALTAQ